jgi:ketosteroid isomerase-like protein
MDEEQARQLAEEWYAAWNARDLERILAHHGEGRARRGPSIA